MKFQTRFSIIFLLLFGFITERDCSPLSQNGVPSKRYVEDDPIIYFTFHRWENRTFSPRILYLLMRQKVLGNLNLPPTKLVSNQFDEPDPEILGLRMNKDTGRNEERGGGRIKSSSSSSSSSITFDESEPEEIQEIVTQNRRVFTTRLQGTGKGKNAPYLFESNSDVIPISYPTDEKEFINLKTTPKAPRLKTTKKLLIPLSISIDRSRSPFENESLVEEDGQDTIRTMDLTLDIVKFSNWGESNNAVFSPFSIINVLSVLLLGSSDKTFQELSRQLQKETAIEGELSNDSNEIKLHKAFQRLTEIITKDSGNQVSLEIANKLFVNDNFPLKENFIESLKRYYGIDGESFDFSRNGDLFKKSVNQWVREKTKDKIKSVIDDPPSPQTTMSLINAVYFQGNWDIPFPKEFTRLSPFYVSSNEQTNIKLMTNELRCQYVSTDSYQMVALPYIDNKTGFFVILPKAPGVKGLRDVEDSLTGESLNQSIRKMDSRLVTIKFPKMRVESTGQMKEILMKMGLKTIFEPNQANFSKISDEDGLFVSSLVHRSILDVNEKGTEGAAVSLVTIDRIIDGRPIPFIVNRPFIFFIYHMKARTILFWGRVIKPLPLPE